MIWGSTSEGGKWRGTTSGVKKYGDGRMTRKGKMTTERIIPVIELSLS